MAPHAIEYRGVGIVRRAWVRIFPGIVSIAPSREADHLPRDSTHYVDFAELSNSRRIADGFSYAVVDPHTWGRLPVRDETVPIVEHIQDARGWPFLALWSGMRIVDDASGEPTALVAGGIRVTDEHSPGDFSEVRALPLRPIPRGLALNTAFYASVWLVLFTAPRALRRHFRSRRGQCPTCAYDLHATPNTCPECGWRAPNT